MDTRAHTPETPTPAPGHSPGQESRADRHLRVLQELTEMCLDAARHVHAELKTQPQPDTPKPTHHPKRHPASILARIAVVIRQTVALESRLAQEQQTRAEGRATNTAKAEADHHARQCRRLRALVEPVLKSAPGAFARQKELDRRLAEMDLDDGFHHRPLTETAARLCRALGLEPFIDAVFTPQPAGPGPP